MWGVRSRSLAFLFPHSTVASQETPIPAAIVVTDGCPLGPLGAPWGFGNFGHTFDMRLAGFCCGKIYIISGQDALILWGTSLHVLRFLVTRYTFLSLLALINAMLLVKWLSKSILAQAVTSLLETSRAIPFNDLYHQVSHTRSRHPRDLRGWDLHTRDDIISATCTNPDQRREWRSLSTTEQEEYISAVQCLATKPSRLNLTTTLYNDFPYVHNELNSQSQ